MEQTELIDSSSAERRISVSVVVAVFNGAKFIRQAVESVFAQTMEGVEIIVVNDGSTDETAAVLQEFNESIRVIHQIKAGVSAARNRGIEAARGDFIAFLDADDYFLLDTKLLEQFDIIRADETCGIVHSGWSSVTESGEKITDDIHWKNKQSITLRDWLEYPAPLPSAMMFRRRALLETGGFDEKMTQAEDMDLVLRWILAGYSTKWLEKATTAYRRHRNNATKNIQSQTEGLEMCWTKFFAHPNVPLEAKALEKNVRYSILIVPYWFNSP